MLSFNLLCQLERVKRAANTMRLTLYHRSSHFYRICSIPQKHELVCLPLQDEGTRHTEQHSHNTTVHDFSLLVRHWYLKYCSGMDVLHAALHVLANDVQTFVQKWGQYRTACTPRLDILHMQDNTASQNMTSTSTSRSFHFITYDFSREAV